MGSSDLALPKFRWKKIIGKNQIMAFVKPRNFFVKKSVKTENKRALCVGWTRHDLWKSYGGKWGGEFWGFVSAAFLASMLNSLRTTSMGYFTTITNWVPVSSFMKPFLWWSVNKHKIYVDFALGSTVRWMNSNKVVLPEAPLLHLTFAEKMKASCPV